MDFKFEKFVETDKSFSARITIRQKTGQLGFNIGAVNRFKIHDFKYGILYFDPRERVVGIELSGEKSAGTIEIKRGNANTYIRAKNFCDKYNIDYSSSHGYELKKSENSGLLFFALDEPWSDAEQEEEDGAESKEEIAENQARIDLDDIF